MAHAHLVDIHEACLLTEAGAQTEDPAQARWLFIAMELADGSLWQRFQASRASGLRGIPHDELLMYMQQAAEGIDYLNHPDPAAGKPAIRHQDIKPHNLLLTSGKVKLADFGLVQVTCYTVTAHLGGQSDWYAPPEFFLTPFPEVTAWSDQYALAATYFHLLVGKPLTTRGIGPLRDADLARHPDLSKMPEGERRTVARALAKDPETRWEDCKCFVRELSKIAPPPDSHDWGERTAFDFTGLPDTRPRVFGRDEQLAFLDRVWEDSRTALVVIHAFGGEGKTALVKKWSETLPHKGKDGTLQGFGYSFYRQGEDRGPVTSRAFFEGALRLFGDANPSEGDEHLRLEKLLRLVTGKRTLLIIDGMEAIQKPPAGDRGAEITDQFLREFLLRLHGHPRSQGLCIVTTRYCPPELNHLSASERFVLELLPLGAVAGRELVQDILGPGNNNADEAIDDLVEEYGGHALALVLVAAYLKDFLGGDLQRRKEIKTIPDTRDGHHARRVIAAYETALRAQGRTTELWLLNIMGFFDRPATVDCLTALRQATIHHLPAPRGGLIPNRWNEAIGRLRQYNLLEGESQDIPYALNVHPLVRDFFRTRLKETNQRAWRAGNVLLYHHFKRSAPRALSQLPKDNYSDEVVCLLRAIHHGCVAGRYSDAFTLLMFRVDEAYRSALGEWGFRWLWLPAWQLLDRTRVTRWLRIGFAKILGRWGFGPLAQFYRGTTELDKPVRFYLANELEEWDLRLNVAEEFYPHGFGMPPVLNDTCLSLITDSTTARCLSYLGRNEEAKVTAERAYFGLKQLNVKPLTYLLASGVAIIHLHLGNLQQALQFATEARNAAINPQQISDMHCVLGTIRAYSGDELGAGSDFVRCVKECRPSIRLLPKYWECLIRHSSLNHLDEVFVHPDQSFEEQHHRNFEQFQTALMLYGKMNLAYRTAVERGSPHPKELLEQILHAYDKVPNTYSRSWYQYTYRAFYIARAASLVAAETKDNKVVEEAHVHLRNAERLARFGGYQLLLIDLLIIRSKLSLVLGHSGDATKEATNALELAIGRQYAWGRDDAATVLQLLDIHTNVGWRDIFRCADWKRHC